MTKSNSCGDLFKLVVPVGWTLTAFMATLAYLLAPLRRQEPPRWGTAALVSLSAFAGVGASLAVYNFHRTASYQLSNADKDAVSKRRNALFRHILSSSIFIVASITLAIFLLSSHPIWTYVLTICGRRFMEHDRIVVLCLGRVNDCVQALTGH